MKLLKERIHVKCEGEAMTQVEINTVDQYQGRDKAMIIVSFVKGSSSDGPVSSMTKQGHISSYHTTYKETTF